MTVKQKSKRNLFSSSTTTAAVSSSSSVHIGEIDPKRRSEIQASAPQKPESFRRIRQNGGEMPVTVSEPVPPPTPPTMTATVRGVTTELSPAHFKPSSQKKILGKAFGFVTNHRHGDGSNNNTIPTAAATADVTSPTRKSPKRMVVSNRHKGGKQRQQQQDHHDVWGNSSNSTAPSTQSDSEHDQQRLISTGQAGGVEFAPAAAVAKKAAAAAAAASTGTGTASARIRRSNKDMAAQTASGSMSSETLSLEDDNGDDDDHDYEDHLDDSSEHYHKSASFHFPECLPGQIEQMSTLDENLRGELVSSYKDNYPDARPIVDESDYVSLASTLDTETISPLDDLDMMEMRQIRQENNRNANGNSPGKKKKKKNYVQEILNRKGSVTRSCKTGAGGKSCSEERWMNRSARDLNETSDNHPSPPSRRESLVRTNTKDGGNGGNDERKTKQSPSSPRDDSGIEVDEAIQIGFAVLRALKASGGSDDDGRSYKKDEIMNHLHSMISEVEELDFIAASNVDRDVALDEVEEYLDMHQSSSKSRSRSSKGSGSGGARSSKRSVYSDDAPAKPSRTRSKDDLELCGNSRNKESSNSTSEDRRARRNNMEPTKTSKSAFIPARFAAKQKYSALDDADDAEDTSDTCGTLNVDMPSLVSADDSSAVPDPEPKSQSSRRRPSDSATSRSQSCRNVMAALDGDDDDEIHVVTPKRGQRRGLREVRRSQSERHIAGADAAAGGVSPPRARSRSKSSRSIANLNSAVEDEAPALRRGRREPGRSRSSSRQRGISQKSSKLLSAENAPTSPRKGRRPTKAGHIDKSSPVDRTTGIKVSSKDRLERCGVAKSPRRNRSRSIASRRSATPSNGNRSRSKDPSSVPRRSQLNKESRSARHLCANESSSASPLKRSMSTSASQLDMKTISMDRTRHNSLTAVHSNSPCGNIGTDLINERQSEKMEIPFAQLSSPVKLSSNPRDTKSYYKHSPVSSSAASARKSLLSHLPKSKSLRSLGESIAFSSLENDNASVAFAVGSQKSRRGVGDAAIANMDWQKSNQK